MYNIPSRFPLILFLGLVGVNLCGTASAKITGNVLFSYDLIKENGKWSGEFEQNINFGMRGRAGLTNLIGLNLGIVVRGKELTILRGLAPTYTLNLQGKHYTFSSGYSVRLFRDIINSRLYENLSVSLPGLPTFKLDYSKQDTRDIPKEHKINSTGSNIQFGIEDEIGPFRITGNRREHTLRDLVRGPEYDVKSSNTSGNVDFTYSYRRLFSLNGRYGIDQLRTERRLTGEIKGETKDFSLGFRISPVSTIALSGTTVGRQEQRGGLENEPSSDSLTNRLQLMLQPVEGILLNATYSKSDNSRDEERLLSNESTLALNVEPWQYLAFSGHFTIYDSQEGNKRLSTLRRNSFDLRTEPIEGLQISLRVDLSRAEDFVDGFYSYSNRNNVTTKLEAMPTRNFRTDISYDWEKFSRRLKDINDAESRHRVAFAANYSFARMLNFNFRSGINISSKWEGKQSATRTLTFEFGQKVNRNIDVRLNYESRLGKREFGTKRISFRVNIRL